MTDLSLLGKSSKVISTCLRSSSEIVSYILEENALKNAILFIYGESSPEFQCKVAQIHLGDDISGYALDILSEMRREGS